MNKLPTDLINIINDYKYQLEHSAKLNVCLYWLGERTVEYGISSSNNPSQTYSQIRFRKKDKTIQYDYDYEIGKLNVYCYNTYAIEFSDSD